LAINLTFTSIAEATRLVIIQAGGRKMKKIVGPDGKITYEPEISSWIWGCVQRFGQAESARQSARRGEGVDRRYYYVDGSRKRHVKIPYYTAVSTSNVVCENCGKDIPYSQVIEIEKVDRDPLCPKCGQSLHPGLAEARDLEGRKGCLFIGKICLFGGIGFVVFLLLLSLMKR
jgi:DNA-directed RNA polymerase subunit RPC12/RpoP